MPEPWLVKIPVEIPASEALNRESEAPEPLAAVLGLDPGSEGFCVVLSLLSDRAKLWPIPPVKIDGMPAVDLRHVFGGVRVRPVCFVERTQGRQGLGATQTFNFGAYSGGAISAILNHGWPVRALLPQAWQKVMHQTAGADPKTRSLDAYRRLFPHDPLPKSRYGNINHNALDALLIATCGALSLGYGVRAWTFS